MRNFVHRIASITLLMLVLNEQVFSQIGVPDIPIDYTMDVEDWWLSHPYNPEGNDYQPDISSPENAVTLSSGEDIQAVIDGANSPITIYLNDGTYNGFNIFGKSDIHIIGNGSAAVITNQSCHVAPTELAANDYGAFTSCLAFEDPDCIGTFLDPPRNIYFRNLVFDGSDNLNIGLWINRTFDMVIDNCLFKDYIDPAFNHLGLIAGRMGSENVWIRNCVFEGSQRYAIYLDGCHGCGTMDSYIDEHFGSGGILYLANDDYTRDYNNNGLQEPDEIRMANYDIIYNNIFEGWIPTAVSIMGANSLVLNNTIRNQINTLAVLNSKASHIWQGLEYEYYGNKVLGNKIEDRVILEMVLIDKFIYENLPLGNDFTVGQYEVRCNEVTGTGILIVETGTIDGPNIIEGNCIDDPNCEPCSLALSTNNFSSSHYAIYPNPVSNYLQIDIKSKTDKSKLYLFDATGKLLIEKTLSGNETSLDLSSLQSGIYFAKISDGSLTYTNKIVKK